MGRSYDRISNLPDPILESILCMMPLKSAVRTSTLSRRWRHLWEYSLTSATTLDFGEDFSSSQSPKDFVHTINRYLQQHDAKNLHKFRVLFSPFDLFLQDIRNWIAFAVEKGVKELDLDLSQGCRDLRYDAYVDERRPLELPQCLLECKTVTCLSLSRCDMIADLNFSSFSNLQSLSLDHVSISQEDLRRLLTHCKRLESLTLSNYPNDETVSVAAPDLGLKRLTVVENWRSYEMEIDAPKLQSLHYYGQHSNGELTVEVPLLVDAFICPLDGASQDFGIVSFLSQISHVQVLTVNSGVLMAVTCSEVFIPDDFPIPLQNLQELQLLLDSVTDKRLDCVYGFFRFCPCPFLEKLFIQLPRNNQDPSSINDENIPMVHDLERPPKVDLSHIKVIKVSNFRGRRNEMLLVKYLLEQAADLETLMLVAPPAFQSGPDPSADKEKKTTDSVPQSESVKRIKGLGLRILRGQLSVLPKASSQAHVEFLEFVDDDTSLNSKHADVHREYCLVEEHYALVTSVHAGVSLNPVV